MTTPLLAVPIFRAFDTSGAPLASGKLFAYAAGTTTAKDTYSDAAGATPNANPVVLDSTGSATVRLGSGGYKFVLKSNDELTTYWTVDNVYGDYLDADRIGALLYPRTAAEITASVTPTEYEYPPGDIRRYGALADGSTNCTTAVNNALAQHNSGGAAVFVPAGTWLVSQIDWPGNNLTMRGESCGYSYNTSASPKSVLKARAATTIVLDLVQTGLAEDRTGNHIVDIDIDGNSIATYGIDVAGSNVLERVRVKGCTTAGVHLANFTNGTRIVRCAFNSNSGWGLQAEGVSSTTYSVTDTNTSLNTSGGIDLQTGVLVHFQNVISESNTGPGLRIYKPNTHTNAFEGFTFDNCWFEDNASASPYFTLVLDSGTSDPVYGPQHVTFRQCRFTAAAVTRKYANLAVCKWVRFEDCQFDNSTEANAITGASPAHHVAFIRCAQNTGSTGITATQMDNFIASANYAYWWEPNLKRVVGAGSPAAAFQNSWANNGGGYAAAKYWFDQDGNVCLEGSVDTGSSGTVAFTLPAGYRPAASMAFAIDANGAHGTALIGTDGTVTLTAASTANTHLNGIKFQRAVA